MASIAGCLRGPRHRPSPLGHEVLGHPVDLAGRATSQQAVDLARRDVEEHPPEGFATSSPAGPRCRMAGPRSAPAGHGRSPGRPRPHPRPRSARAPGRTGHPSVREGARRCLPASGGRDAGAVGGRRPPTRRSGAPSAPASGEAGSADPWTPTGRSDPEKRFLPGANARFHAVCPPCAAVPVSPPLEGTPVVAGFSPPPCAGRPPPARG